MLIIIKPFMFEILYVLRTTKIALFLSGRSSIHRKELKKITKNQKIEETVTS